jgi:hypothetical protein
VKGKGLVVLRAKKDPGSTRPHMRRDSVEGLADREVLQGDRSWIGIRLVPSHLNIPNRLLRPGKTVYD